MIDHGLTFEELWADQDKFTSRRQRNIYRGLVLLYYGDLQTERTQQLSRLTLTELAERIESHQIKQRNPFDWSKSWFNIRGLRAALSLVGNADCLPEKESSV